MSVDLGAVFATGRGQAERFTGPVQVGIPIGTFQRQTFADGRFINLDDFYAGFSRSNTSSFRASAICLHTVERGISLRTKDHCRMVTGPVNIPFIGRLVRL